jgi:hypothetical protein
MGNPFSKDDKSWSPAPSDTTGKEVTDLPAGSPTSPDDVSTPPSGEVNKFDVYPGDILEEASNIPLPMSPENPHREERSDAGAVESQPIEKLVPKLLNEGTQRPVAEEDSAGKVAEERAAPDDRWTHVASSEPDHGKEPEHEEPAADAVEVFAEQLGETFSQMTMAVSSA